MSFFFFGGGCNTCERKHEEAESHEEATWLMIQTLLAQKVAPEQGRPLEPSPVT